MSTIKPKIELDFKKSLEQIKKISAELLKLDKLLSKGNGTAGALGGSKASTANIEKRTKLQKQLANATTKLAKSVSDERVQLSRLNRENKLASQVNDNQTKSVARLQAKTNELVQQFKRMEIGSKAWTLQAKRIRDNTVELKKYDALIGRQNRNVGNYSGGILRATTAITGMTASLYSINIALRTTVRLLAEVSDSQASVEKTTGLSRDAVRGLTDSFKQIDTRTAIKDLLAIASAAGKMGVAKEDIRDFTEVADKVIVAFADDLEGNTKQIVTDLAKMTRIFPDLKDLSPAEALQKLSSAMNFLANNTTAAVEPIKNITNRLLGVASTVGISSDKVVGLAAALDRMGAGSEVAATAVIKMLTEMGDGKNFDKFSKLAKNAGIETKEFSRLLEEDAFEAFMKVVEGAGGSAGGIKALQAVIEDFGINTKRAVVIAAALTSNFDILKDSVEKSTKATKEATSIDEEFNIMNTTLGANLDKLSKAFSNIALNQNFVKFLENATENAEAFTDGVIVMISMITGALIPALLTWGRTLTWVGVKTTIATGGVNLLAAAIAYLASKAVLGHYNAEQEIANEKLRENNRLLEINKQIRSGVSSLVREKINSLRGETSALKAYNEEIKERIIGLTNEIDQLLILRKIESSKHGEGSNLINLNEQINKKKAALLGYEGALLLIENARANTTRRQIGLVDDLSKAEADAQKKRLSDYLDYKIKLEEFDKEYFDAFKKLTTLQLKENENFAKDSIGLQEAVTRAYKQEVLDRRGISGFREVKPFGLDMVDIEDVEKTKQNFDSILDAADNFNLRMKKIGDDIASNLGDKLGGAFDKILLEGKSVTASLASAWVGFKDSFISMINQMVAKALAFAAVQAFLGLGGSGNGVSFGQNILNSLLGVSGGTTKTGGQSTPMPAPVRSGSSGSGIGAIIASNERVIQAINNNTEITQRTLVATQTTLDGKQLRTSVRTADLQAKSTVPLNRTS